MKKLSLSAWAAIGELVASVAVVVSLYFLIIGINQNTNQARADSNQSIFVRVTEIELMVAADPSWTDIVLKGRNANEEMTEHEKYRFDAYVTAKTDVWDDVENRYIDGVLFDDDYIGWKLYLEEWARRNVSQESWDRVRWNYYEDAPVSMALRAATGIE